MSEMERLVFLATPTVGDGVRLQFEQAVEQFGKKHDISFKQVPHMSVALQALRYGDADVIGMSAFDWKELDTSGLIIAGLLPRRESTYVLVADDKPEYLVSKALVVCDSELVTRQMRRLRADLNLVSIQEFAKSISKEAELEELDAVEVTRWLEEARQDALLDGYITTRSMHATLPFKARRHTLGLQRENPERARFIPPALNGFTLLVARSGFPTARLHDMVDPSSFICYRMEVSIQESLPENLQEITGILVEQRKISTIIREAKRTQDEQTLAAIVNPEKKVKVGGNRLELKIETLNRDGTVTAAAERVCPIEDSHMGMVALLREFNLLLSAMMQEHEEVLRAYEGLPEEYKEARSALLDLDE